LRVEQTRTKLNKEGDCRSLELAPDLGDPFLCDLLAACADLVRVTGDKLLLQDTVMQDRVILPQTFVTQCGALWLFCCFKALLNK
jgi:hypothetical protein